MAVQGTPIEFRVTPDMVEYPTTDVIEVEIYQNKINVIKFRYPAATGYTTLSVDGSEYVGIIPAATTLTMRGLYGIEIIQKASTTVLVKGNNDDFLTVTSESQNG